MVSEVTGVEGVQHQISKLSEKIGMVAAKEDEHLLTYLNDI